jgi:biopolymer transport protein ExbD
MAGGAQGDGDDDLIVAINVTPLVDVVLVLLVILMVTASYIVSKSIPMDLPHADSGESQTQPRTLTVSIDQSGQLFLDADRVDRSVLRERVRAYARNNNDARAIIAADGRVSHAQVVQIIDLLRQEHVNHFAINVNPRDLQQDGE